MLKVENVETFNFEGAIRGMRNPLESWGKSDSDFDGTELGYFHDFTIGENDLGLMRRLYKGGPEHRKYLRQIFVCMDIIAPRYWFVEFDTYKVGVTSNSCSTMHTIHKKPFDIDDFSHDHLVYTGEGDNPIDMIIKWLNYYREKYLETGNKEYWYNMIQLLPQSYNQRRTITMNYENVINIIFQRSGHKLDEWSTFIGELMELPYVKDIMADARNRLGE